MKDARYTALADRTHNRRWSAVPADADRVDHDVAVSADHSQLVERDRTGGQGSGIDGTRQHGIRPGRTEGVGYADEPDARAEQLTVDRQFQVALGFLEQQGGQWKLGLIATVE